MEFEAIGTHWSISLLELPSNWTNQRAESLFTHIRERIEQFDAMYSRFRDDSLVSDMARAAGIYQLPEDAQPLMDLYKRLYQITNGKFTPLIGQLISDAGYDATYSLKTKPLTGVPEWDDVLEYQFPTLTVRTPALLDFGAAGKGYLVDIVSRLIEEAGVLAYVVNAGGDIRVKGSARRIGLEDPADTSKIIGVAEISEGSICGSATNRRAWGEYHHIFDPALLDSVRDIQAVWVTASTALYADALATCLFLVLPEELTNSFPDISFEYLILRNDRSLQVSDKFPGELFIAPS